jgi:hypothetical protein
VGISNQKVRLFLWTLKKWLVETRETIRKLFSKLAIILLELPRTEAVCERLVSRFEALFPKSRCLSGDDLIKAQMRIKMFDAWEGISKESFERTAGPGLANRARLLQEEIPGNVLDFR